MKGIELSVSVVIALLVFYSTCQGIPLLDSDSDEDRDDSDQSDNNNNIQIQNLPKGFNLSGFNLTGLRNDTPKNLYVVKAVVYEIGILTEGNENDTSSEETRERVDLTFFDAHKNDSFIDLGNIPLPIQTNISGQVLTGIAPVNVGAFSNPYDLLKTLPLTGTIVNITHSDTSYFRLTTSNLTNDEQPHLLKPDDISKIPQVSDALSPKIQFH